jgi:uncharacterized membrane protein YagU involved in acid resistance
MGSRHNIDSQRSRALLAIFWGGFLVGVFDIVYAFIEWVLRGVPPIRILQGIATGVLGPASFRGGVATAALGLSLHFLIAFGAATVYYSASRFIPLLTREAVICGLLYGIAVYCFMHYVVIPLSRIRRRPFDVVFDSIEIVEHMLLVGLPIALACRRFSGSWNNNHQRNPSQTTGAASTSHA